MQTKRKPRRQANDPLDNKLGQQCAEAYLKATQAEFEAAIERARKLGLTDTGVLAGPRLRAKRSN